ncbi:hypothetical protein BGZ61DRAFT_445540 [Ilyonectria robusta]|uniref:uncharacterized protein n=1 Tax=Ilyonectria robusta TaxID=1079257 RepID=UPI001E8D00C0|nr:uncharacterized protein BGZ61DRAFT_445540 [Ilyonectria robusta]KAH8733930.1 hypothetical protein BGZ61DRAFT_445540 [Ilyonectria robusta]
MLHQASVSTSLILFLSDVLQKATKVHWRIKACDVNSASTAVAVQQSRRHVFCHSSWRQCYKWKIGLCIYDTSV